MNLQLVQVLLQAFVALVFVGSFTIAFYNLHIIKSWHTTNALKNLMDDYRVLINESLFDIYHEDLKMWKEELLQSPFMPHTFYYQRMKKISRIGEFYEQAGVMVRKKLIDFNVMFELLPFPDNFWETTEEFRLTMQKITYADFWYNFEYLRGRYLVEREKRKKPQKKGQVLAKIGQPQPPMIG